MKRAIILGLAAVAAMTQAWAGDPPKNNEPEGLDTKEASIPFLNQRDSIFDWQANGQEGLWVQDARKQWYYAKLFAPCFGLDFAVQIGFKTRALNRLDRDSEIIVPDSGHCTLSSLRKSGPPPQGKHHGRSADLKDAAKDASKDAPK